MSHVRFTPEEYRVLCRLCRDLDFRDRGLNGFRTALAERLRDGWPELADRVTRLRRSELQLVFEHMRTRAGQAASRREGDAKEVGRLGGLTFEEFRAVARAASRFLLYDGRPCAFRAFLIHHFKGQAMPLARKLERLNDRQIEELYERVKKPSRWRA